MTSLSSWQAKAAIAAKSLAEREHKQAVAAANVWRIDDGEIHIVVASDEAGAIQVVVDTFDWEMAHEYKEDMGGRLSVATLGDDEKVQVRIERGDVCSADDWIPFEATIFFEVTAQVLTADPTPRLISSTVF